MKASNSDLTLTAVGDIITPRRLSNTQDKGFQEAVERLMDSDVTFANLETLIHDFEGYPAATKPGIFMHSPPGLADELDEWGIDIVSAATNHTFDYSYGGIEATMRELEERDVSFAGIGENLAEARRPRYVDTPGGRVAVVSACSSITPGSVAGKQTETVEGRPGLSPQRYDVVYEVPEDTYETIVEMSEKLGLERRKQVHTNGTFVDANPDEGETPFRLLICNGNKHPRIVEGDKFEVKLIPRRDDLKEILRQVKVARRTSDWVVASLHAHEGAGANFNDQTVAPFIEVFAKNCIDAGADVFVGHGPHTIRGVEIYEGAPLFYSLGNFVSQHYLIDKFPAEVYDSSDYSNAASVIDLFDYRNKTANDSTTGNFHSNSMYWESILPVVEFEEGTLSEIRVYPLDLLQDQPRPRRGMPTVADGAKAQKILNTLQELSGEYGTDIEIDDGVGTIAI